ncbi:MAG TPA: sulfurtransferase TusA family protein [Candidatus Limnocylindria bacterium]|nr:sulfurtransferase TusA family protein [Candidatus Limnocylindria bacterium]
MTTTLVARTLDCSGLACPLPIVKTAQAMKQLAPGELIEVLATDKGAKVDFPAWSKATGNPIVEASEDGATLRFVIRKKG